MNKKELFNEILTGREWKGRIGFWQYVKVTVENCPECGAPCLFYWSEEGGNAYQCGDNACHNAGVWS